MTRRYMALLLSLTMLFAVSSSGDATGLGGNPPNPVASITDVSVSATSHVAGAATVIQVTVHTLNVANDTAVTVRLSRNDGTPVEGVEATATIQINQAEGTLSLPASLHAGGYLVSVNIASLGLSDSTTAYTITQPAQPAIVSVTLSDSTGIAGAGQNVTVEVNTASVQNGTAVRITLTDSAGNTVSGVDAQTTIIDNRAHRIVSLPDSLQIGVYRIRVEVADLIDESAVYTVQGEGGQHILLGDVNGDGYVNAADMVPIIRHTLGIELITCQRALAAADVNGDGYITVADVVAINLHVLGIVPLP